MSERLLLVAVRDRASGSYLASGASWTPNAAHALVLDESVARALVARFACEPDAVELVDASSLSVSAA